MTVQKRPGKERASQWAAGASVRTKRRTSLSTTTPTRALAADAAAAPLGAHPVILMLEAVGAERGLFVVAPLVGMVMVGAVLFGRCCLWLL